MAIATDRPALLVLADGTAYRGRSFGAPGTAIGEVVFNTGMTGYQEVLTDPSYCGQIVSFTYPELGNTGVNPEDEESGHPQVQGAIARNICHPLCVSQHLGIAPATGVQPNPCPNTCNSIRSQPFMGLILAPSPEKFGQSVPSTAPFPPKSSIQPNCSPPFKQFRAWPG